MRPGTSRRDDRTRAFAYFASLPAQKAGALMLAMWVNALVTLLLRGLVLLKLTRLAARVRARRAAGERLLAAGDASTSTRILLAATLGHDLARRIAAAVLRRKADEAIRSGAGDVTRAQAVLDDPVARKKSMGELYGIHQPPPTA